MATEVEKLSLLLEVQGQKFENQLKRQNSQAYRIFKQLEDRASQMEKGVSASFGALGKRIAGVFAGLAVGSALNDIRKAVDSYQKVINSLKVAGVADADLPKTLDAVYQSATKNAVPMEALASLYGRVRQAQTTLGTTSGELLKFTDLVAQGLRVSGTSATEASGSLLQLGQALSGGKVQAEEYNSLLDGQYLPLKDCGHALPQSPRRFLGTAFLYSAEECDHVRGADWEALSGFQQTTLELVREIAAIQDREGDDP